MASNGKALECLWEENRLDLVGLGLLNPDEGLIKDAREKRNIYTTKNS